MADLTRGAAILANEWQHRKDDADRYLDPAFGDAEAGEMADIAERLCDSYERDLVALQARIRLAKRPFITDWPALSGWRESVLSAPRRHPPATVAAALEAMALECELAGFPELAQQSRREAESLILHTARSA